MAKLKSTIEETLVLPAGETLAHEPLQLTPEEIQAILATREQRKVGNTPETTVEISHLATALITAINATKPPEKKTPYNRKRNSPYWPKDGTPKLKFKRKAYQHGLEIDDDKLYNSTVEKMNRVKPGKYCDGWVTVQKRKDGGINIEYPVRTAAQRLKLVNVYGVTKFEDLLDRILDEKANPHKYRRPGDDDDE